MNEYLKKYIELKKQFSVTDGGPECICALYKFKEELEQSENKQAREVLVDVYDMLDLKKMHIICSVKLVIYLIKRHLNG